MSHDSSIDLRAVRRELGLSQAGLADLIGVSLRAIQSCEQGWRKPGQALEKAVVLLLLASRKGSELGNELCWDSIDCSEVERKNCLVYQSQQGHLCWLLSGNICKGRRLRTWQDKKDVCLQCPFFRDLLPEGIPTNKGPVPS